LRGVDTASTNKKMNERPSLIVAWEVTAACNLSCGYCRAEAMTSPAPDELSTNEATAFIDEIAPLSPMIIFSGGEAIMRPDIFFLARQASDAGLRVSLATNGTMLSSSIVDQILKSGITRVSVSLDGTTAKTNDRTRGEGSFERALSGISALSGRVPFQINMTITRNNASMVHEMAALASQLQAAALHLFFMVPTGRGRMDDLISAIEQEEVLKSIGSINSPEIQVTCAPQHARILHQTSPGSHSSSSSARGKKGGGCLAGSKFIFISRTGEVYPCGYLQLSAGNIRDQPILKIWESSPLLLDLRKRRLRGRCAACSYQTICGGCRARAYSMSGDPMGEDPLCAYEG
jgi:radical SAM protein with 4Fe4S-binding SPASM domain